MKHTSLVIPACVFTYLFAAATCHGQVGGLFGLGKAKPTTVTLVTQLPAIAVPMGKSVELVSTMAGKAMQPEAAEILKEQIRTLLMQAQEANLQVVDSGGDTVIKCIVTSYEPKVMHPGTRQRGTSTEKIETWSGTIEASVQVSDQKGHSIDAGILKYHMENDYVIGKQESKLTTVFGKKLGLADKAAEVINISHGGNSGDIAQALGGSPALAQALNVSQAKDAPPPTDLEWRNALIEGMAVKVANQIVPVKQAIIAILPGDKEFNELRTLALGNHWGDVQEQADKMPQQKPGLETYRIYMLGLSNEALADTSAGDPTKAAELLNKATGYYRDAHGLSPTDHELELAQLRAQDSLDHFLQVQHYLKAKAAADTPPPTTKTGGADSAAAADNAAVIEMAKAKMADSIIITFVQTAPSPKFDISATGLLALGRAGVSSSVIQALQNRMSPAAAPAPRAGSAKTPVQRNKTAH